MNNSSTNEEINILSLQIFSSTLFIITTIVSIVIVYNELHNLKYNERLISTEAATKIVKINRTIITILLSVFIYINYKTKDLDLRKGINTKPDDLQILASYISLIAGLIVLYAVFRFGENAIINTENPDV